MALGTATIVDRHERGDLKFIKLSFAGDDSYPSGGTPDFNQYIRDAIAAAAAAAVDKNVRDEEGVSCIEVIAGNCGAYVPSYDSDNDKLYVRDIADGAQSSGDLSTTTFEITAVCK